MRFRRRKETISHDDLLFLLAGVYAQLDAEMLLHATRCAAHLYAVRNEVTPRAVYEQLFKTDHDDEQWRAWMESLADNSRAEV